MEVEPCELTVIFLCDTGCLEDVVAELLLVVCGVEHEERHKEHTLISALKILQDFLCLVAVGSKVGRNDVHIITGANRLFLFLNGHLLQIGDLALDRLDCLGLVNRLNVHRNDQTGFHIEEVSEHTVVEFGSENLQKRHRTELFAYAKLLAVAELKGAWGDKVLYGKTAWSEPFPLKVEIGMLVDVEHTVHESQTLFAVQGFSRYAEPLEVVKQIGLNAVETGFCFFHVGSFDAEGQILGLDKTVIATGKLIAKHFRVFLTDVIEVVALRGNDDTLTVGVLVCRHIHKRQLELNRAVKVIKEITPALKDRCFILVLIELIVDVLELDGLGEVAGFYTAHPIGEHTLKRDAVLCRLLFVILIFRSCDGGFDLLLFRPRELSLFGQYDIPPCRVFPVALKPNRSYWSDTVSASGEGSRPVRCYGQSFQGAVRSFRT